MSLNQQQEERYDYWMRVAAQRAADCRDKGKPNLRWSGLWGWLTDSEFAVFRAETGV